MRTCHLFLFSISLSYQVGSFFSSLKDDEKRKKIVGEAGRKGSGIENGDGSCEMVGEGGRKKGLDHTASVFFFSFFL